MSRKRRQVSLDDASSWIHNRMVEEYEARPAYPEALVDALVELMAPVGSRVLDLGAGIGHLALPLARRGLEVVAIEPAKSMLERLEHRARAQGVVLRALHAAAEALPFQAPSFDGVLIADALHFLDTELAAAELRRVLVPQGVLAVVTCDFAETPFMRGVRNAVEATADRRPRKVEQAILQLAALAEVTLTEERHFEDATPVDAATLECILRSVSFVGPAFSEARFASFRRRLNALTEQMIWARTLTLRAGRRRRRTSPR
jgi:2-polyprenyl-3-methyl-5-hydroxy-6-metoxy-1,4-benzoquinol methylase